jgi:hypothetical protein
MNEREHQALWELSWRRKLTPSEEARLQQYLTQHPEAQAGWETEAALNHLLRQLPDAPLSSNFTAQTLQAVEREAVRATRETQAFGRLREWLRRLAPRMAWAAGLIFAAFLVWQQHEISQRERVVGGIGPVLQAASLPDPKMLQDFDAIQQLSQLPPATDVELLDALSQ